MKGIVIKPNGESETLEHQPTNDLIQDRVGGYWDRIRFRDGCVMYLNDNGYTLNLEPNAVATTFALAWGYTIRYPLVGTAVVCMGDHPAHRDAELPEDAVSVIMDIKRQWVAKGERAN